MDAVRCIDVTGAYSSQKTELNISLTAIGLLWTSTDFIAKGLLEGPTEYRERGLALIWCQLISFHYNKFQILYSQMAYSAETLEDKNGEKKEQTQNTVKDSLISVAEHEKLLFSVFSLLQNLGADERPEVLFSSTRQASSLLIANMYVFFARY